MIRKEDEIKLFELMSNKIEIVIEKPPRNLSDFNMKLIEKENDEVFLEYDALQSLTARKSELENALFHNWKIDFDDMFKKDKEKNFEVQLNGTILSFLENKALDDFYNLFKLTKDPYDKADDYERISQTSSEAHFDQILYAATLGNNKNLVMNGFEQDSFKEEKQKFIQKMLDKKQDLLLEVLVKKQNESYPSSTYVLLQDIKTEEAMKIVKEGDITLPKGTSAVYFTEENNKKEFSETVLSETKTFTFFNKEQRKLAKKNDSDVEDVFLIRTGVRGMEQIFKEVKDYIKENDLGVDYFQIALNSGIAKMEEYTKSKQPTKEDKDTLKIKR